MEEDDTREAHGETFFGRATVAPDDWAEYQSRADTQPTSRSPPDDPGREPAGGRALAGHWHRAEAVGSGRSRDHHGRQRARRPRGQLLHGGGTDGEEQWRAGRKGRAPVARSRPRRRLDRRSS